MNQQTASLTKNLHCRSVEAAVLLAVFVAVDVSPYAQLSVLHEQPYKVCHFAVILLFSLKLSTFERWALKFKRSILFRVLVLHLSFYVVPFVPHILVPCLHYFLIPRMISFTRRGARVSGVRINRSEDVSNMANVKTL